jgi:hypothetical protein
MMKINKSLIKASFINVTLIALCVFVFSSCLKDKAPGNQNYSHSPALVGFQYTGNGPKPYVAAIPGTAEDTISIEVTLSAQSITLGAPVTLTVVPYQAGLDSFNTANGTAYQQMDPSLYTLQNGGNVTISPGQQYVTIRINFAGDQVDFNQPTGIGLQITNAKGAIIATNLNTALVLISLKSPYEANYHVSGARIHPTLGTLPFDYDADMATVDANTIIGPAAFDFQTDLELQVNADNSVTIVSAPGFDPVFTQAGMQNTYDPATQTFTLHYYYNAGAPRLINETLVRN